MECRVQDFFPRGDQYALGFLSVQIADTTTFLWVSKNHQHADSSAWLRNKKPLRNCKNHMIWKHSHSLVVINRQDPIITEEKEGYYAKKYSKIIIKSQANTVMHSAATHFL